MKILYVVQAYGPDVFGGAESHCRMMASRMAARGHEVDVLTSRAVSYYDWANHYPEGTSEFEGVKVHRLSVEAPRDHRRFGPLSGRVLTGHKPVPLFMQRRWMEMQGPDMPDLQSWLWDHALDYDTVIFFTYLYAPTVKGLPMVSGRVPTVMHPTAHDERPLYLPIFDTLFKLPTGYAFSVEEDAELVKRRFNPSCLQSIVGIGVEQDVTADGERFRKAYDLDDPYLVCVGRFDPAKGSDDLYAMFTTYKQRNPGPLKLVFVGEPIKPVEPHPDVIVTGFVERQLRDDALAGAVASVHPSYFESFSMALAEAWALSKPAIVNGRCEVFAGQARRSGGAIPYDRFAEFENAVDMVTGDEVLQKRLGNAGRAYVESRYRWEDVMARYETLLERVPVV